MASSGLRILFSGMIAADPFQGGAIWAVMQYVLGLKRLGHDVLFVEPIPFSAIRSANGQLAGSPLVACFTQVVDEFGLHGSAALLAAFSAAATVLLASASASVSWPARAASAASFRPVVR